MYLCREHKTKTVTNMALCFRLVDRKTFSANQVFFPHYTPENTENILQKQFYAETKS
jgi:hypothetical protein